MATSPGSSFQQALNALHERFMVGVGGVAEVWLVRHGDAYAELVSADDHIVDVEGVRRLDPPLSPKGRSEAARLGERLRASGVDAFWASDLTRARETAEIAAEGTGMAVRLDPRLREVRTHWDEGGPQPPREEAAPASRYIPFHTEDLEEATARMRAAVLDIAAAVGPGGRAVAVSHAAAISVFVADALRQEFGSIRMLLEFTSVSVVKVKDGRFVVQSLGDVGHLARERVPEGMR
jgi:broad specificity phosphatase PhoE